MAHPEQQAFFDRLKLLFPEQFQSRLHVLEVGSQDINGSIRILFEDHLNYLGLDLSLAKGVDWTVPGELIELPDGWADTCISTECFEHAHCWDQILVNMIRITKPGGLLILTFAGDERPAHGTVDSEEGSSPFTTSYYRNLGADDIASKIRLGYYFDRHGFEINSLSKDTYFWGVRSEQPVSDSDSYWRSPLDRLARAQGQLSHAVLRHNMIKQEAEQLRNALAAAQAESAELRLALQQARSEVYQLKTNRLGRLATFLRNPAG